MNDVLEELLGYLQTAMGSSITTYYRGRVQLPPRHYLPCLQVYAIRTEQTAKSTAKDQSIYTIGIRVVEDVTTKLSESGTGNIIKAQDSIVDLMEERDAGGIAVADSVMGVIRRNIRGTHYLFTRDIVVDYEDMQDEGFFYTACDMRLTAVTDQVLRQ